MWKINNKEWKTKSERLCPLQINGNSKIEKKMIERIVPKMMKRTEKRTRAVEK
jgi:hypothetical protein